jgi:ubiquitin-conjugating enzyme E2 D/E
LFAVLIWLCGLLDTPNPEYPMEPAIAELYKHDRKQYDVTATAWTKEHAHARGQQQEGGGK